MADTDLVLADTKLVGLPDRFQPRNLTELMGWAKLVNSSGLAPKGMNDAGIILAVQMGAELGVTPTQALQNIAVINGRPSIWGDLGLAIFRRDAKFETFEERDPAEAMKLKEGWCKIKMKGVEKPIIRTFTLDEAEKAGLIKRSQGGSDAKGVGPWVTYPGRMLMFRARWWAMRDAAPEVFKGLSGREEQQDIVDTEARVVHTAPYTAPARTDAGGLDAKEVENFVKNVKPAASGEAPGSKPPIDRSKLVKMMVLDAVERAGGTTTYYKIKLQPASGPAIEPSTFHASLYKEACDLKGKFALVFLKTTTAKDKKQYLNIEHIEAEAAAAAPVEEAPPAPEQDEPGSAG